MLATTLATVAPAKRRIARTERARRAAAETLDWECMRLNLNLWEERHDSCMPRRAPLAATQADLDTWEANLPF
jgi:hypothetical protein